MKRKADGELADGQNVKYMKLKGLTCKENNEIGMKRAKEFAKQLKDKIDIFKTKGRTFDVILADPPWNYDAKAFPMGNALTHYTTLPDELLMQMPVKDLTSKDCMLLMWVTAPMMQRAMPLFKAWGFKYKTIFVNWVKTFQNGNPVCNMGSYTRSCSEFLLLGVRGKVTKWREDKGVSQLLTTVRRQHSRKPDELFDLLKRYFGESYDKLEKIELFAREPRDGWFSWGNETTKFKNSAPFGDECDTIFY